MEALLETEEYNAPPVVQYLADNANLWCRLSDVPTSAELVGLRTLKEIQEVLKEATDKLKTIERVITAR